MKTFLIALVLGVALAAGVAWTGGFWNPLDPIRMPIIPGTSANVAPAKPKVELGDPLYTAVPLPANTQQTSSRMLSGPDVVVIPATTNVYGKQEVSSTKQDGKILFIGKVVDPKVVPDAIPVVIPLGGERKPLKFYYRQWNEREIVEPGEMVAYLDPGLAQNEVFKTQFQVKIAEWELKSAEAATGETKSQYDRTVQQFRLNPNSVSAEEMSMKEFVWKKHQNDEKVKEHAIDAARADAEKAELMLGYHLMKNEMLGRGIIKAIHKKTGEYAKPGETIVMLHNIDPLRAEGLVGAEYLYRLKDPSKLKVSLEPIEDQPPFRRLEGHSSEVTSVAFSAREAAITDKEKARLVVSASSNKVLIHTLDRTIPRRTLTHPESVTVQVVACSPLDDKEHNWCLTGASDGSVRLWDLNSPKDEPKWVQENKHAYGVTALAFSPDGQFFATGGEDNQIILWETTTGKDLYAFDAQHGVEEGHQGAITALTFTPQARLVSTARDNTLRVWELHQGGVKLLTTRSDRGGTVSNLGVSQDGRYMLFDKGRKLQLLSGATATAVSELNTPIGGTSFETLALFSPDSYLMLTAGGPDGRLDLWKTPEEGGRGMEVRQYVTKEHSPVTCAAFAPAKVGADPAFAVSGTKDGYVYIWGVPSRKTVEHHAITDLPAPVVERSIEGGNQVRVSVFVRNPRTDDYPDGRFVPGGSVNLVIEHK